MKRIALVTAEAARALDEDLVPLIDACTDIGLPVTAPAWDDASFDWSSVSLAVLRSPWDYSTREQAFHAWIGRVSEATTLLNPAELIRWNADKRYLLDLAAAGVPVIPTGLVLDPAQLQAPQGAAEFVVKPSVGAGSKGCRRLRASQLDLACAHAADLIAQGKTPIVQPYLSSVDTRGETALIFLGGVFSHAIRKGPLLNLDEEPTRALFAAEHITPRAATAAEIAVAQACLAAVPWHEPLAYARVDLIEDAGGAPQVLELEITEPSLFFNHAPGAAARFAAELRRRALGAAGAGMSA